MQRLIVAMVAVGLALALPILGESSEESVAAESSSGSELDDAESDISLSPIWGANIRQWSSQIAREAQSSGLDPDFIAAVIHAESNGEENVVSRVGAVGLMGVMPSGPGLEWRPSPETLMNPDINMNWGVAILAEIIRDSGGDIAAALAAYSGGWAQANSRVPREYASRVLDQYGRAVAARTAVTMKITSNWTIASEFRRGYIPVEPLVFNDRPVSGVRTFGEHLIFKSADNERGSIHVKGFAVPLDLIVPIGDGTTIDGNDTLDERLMARLDQTDIKVNQSNPKVILSCLPSLTRLRGVAATRWYAPSACPSWHR